MTREEYLKLQKQMWQIIEDKLQQKEFSVDVENGILGEYLSEMFVEALSGINPNAVEIIFNEEEQDVLQLEEEKVV